MILQVGLVSYFMTHDFCLAIKNGICLGWFLTVPPPKKKNSNFFSGFFGNLSNSLDVMLWKHPLKLTAKAPENRPFQNEISYSNH